MIEPPDQPDPLHPPGLALPDRVTWARRRAAAAGGSGVFVVVAGTAAALAWNPILWMAALPLSVLLFHIASRQARQARIWQSRVVARRAYSDPRPPVLLLRSFSQPVLTAARPQYHVRGGSADGVGGTTFLWHFSEAIAPFAGVLALGAPAGDQRTEAPEALFLQTADAVWFDVFRTAAAGCRAAVLIPDTSEGVAREMRALASHGLGDRLLVFMPPTPKPAPAWTPFRTQDPDALAQRWAVVRAAWAADGLRLPAYNPAGLLYRAAPDLSVYAGVELAHWLSVPGLRHAIEALLPPVSTGVPLSAMLADLEGLGVVPCDAGAAPAI